MSTSPQLSVIIPTYNRATLLPRTIESVLQQTYSDYEIVVVDDGSRDRTEERLAELLKEKPAVEERIRYFFQRNQGKSVALNRGLLEARGEWIAFLDSDDLWLPTKIEEQFRALEEYASLSRACFTNARYINNPSSQGTAFERAGRRFRDTTGMLTHLGEYVANPFGFLIPTLVAHSRILKKVGEFDPTLRVMEDIDFIFRLALETRLCFVNAPLALIDRTPQRPEGLIENMVRNVSQSLGQQQRVYERWLSLSEGLEAEVRKPIYTQLRGIHSKWANWFLKNKQYRDALASTAKAAHAELTLSIAAKWCLIAFAPALARNIVIRRSCRDPEQKVLMAMVGADMMEGGVPHSGPVP
jgi:glycosyltransferase involved in cell wall biosynthesis